MNRFKWVNELRDLDNLDRLRVVKNINDTVSKNVSRVTCVLFIKVSNAFLNSIP